MSDISFVLRLKIIRRFFRRTLASLQYGSLGEFPILFANSFPKSGTHLLTQILHGFTKLGPAVNSGLAAIVNFDGPSGTLRSTELITKELKRLRGGDIAYGHLHADPDVVEELLRPQIVPFFLYRDPRDVVVSHVHYVTELEPDHVHHDYYVHKLAHFDDRLAVSILGRPELGNLFPNIQQRFDPYLDWMDKSEIMSLRYEDLIQNRRPALELILNHVIDRGFPLKYSKDFSLEILNSEIRPEKSPTFRQGVIGKWRETFTEVHKELFKNTAGDLLIRLGYEDDYDW